MSPEDPEQYKYQWTFLLCLRQKMGIKRLHGFRPRGLSWERADSRYARRPDEISTPFSWIICVRNDIFSLSLKNISLVPRNRQCRCPSYSITESTMHILIEYEEYAFMALKELSMQLSMVFDNRISYACSITAALAQEDPSKPKAFPLYSSSKSYLKPAIQGSV